MLSIYRRCSLTRSHIQVTRNVRAKSDSDVTGAAQLTSLEALDLFSGPLPTELGQLTALTYLYLPINQFSDPLPTELLS